MVFSGDLELNTPLVVVACVAALVLFRLLGNRKGYSTKHYQCIPLLTEREQGLDRIAVEAEQLPGAAADGQRERDQ